MGKKLPKKYKIRGSFATYRIPSRKNDVCDLEEVANELSCVGNIPVHMGFAKASEIAFMARMFLCLFRDHKRKKPISRVEDKT